MSEIIQIVPSEWVTEDLLVKMTGLRPGTIARARKKVGYVAGSTSTCLLTASQRKTASACITTKRSTSGLRASKRNSRVRANEDPFMLSGLLDVRRE